MHEISSRFRALSDMERIKLIGHDWHQKHVKKIGKIMHENQISIPSMQRFFGSKSLP